MIIYDKSDRKQTDGGWYDAGMLQQAGNSETVGIINS